MLGRLKAWLFPPKPPLTGDVHQWWPGKRLWQKPGPWCRTKSRLGRRGAMLLLLGLLYVLLAYRELLMTAPFTAGAWHFLVPTWVRAVAWASTGLAACWFAVARGHRTPPVGRPVTRWQTFLVVWRTDTFGWLALYIVPALYITSYGASWLTWLIFDYLFGTVPPTLPLHGDPTAWTSAVLRIPMIIAALICSGWKENPPRSDCR